MVNGSGAVAATGGNGMAEGILQSAAFERRIDARISDGAGEIPGKDWAFRSTHQRCSIHK